MQVSYIAGTDWYCQVFEWPLALTYSPFARLNHIRVCIDLYRHMVCVYVAWQQSETRVDRSRSRVAYKGREPNFEHDKTGQDILLRGIDILSLHDRGIHGTLKVGRNNSVLIGVKIRVLDHIAVEKGDKELCATGLEVGGLELELNGVTGMGRRRVDGEGGERCDGELRVAIRAGDDELRYEFMEKSAQRTL